MSWQKINAPLLHIPLVLVDLAYFIVHPSASSSVKGTQSALVPFRAKVLDAEMFDLRSVRMHCWLLVLARYRHAPTLSCATNTPGWPSLVCHQSQWSESLHRKREICPLAFMCTLNLQWSTKPIAKSCDGHMRSHYPHNVYTYVLSLVLPV